MREKEVMSYRTNLRTCFVGEEIGHDFFSPTTKHMVFLEAKWRPENIYNFMIDIYTEKGYNMHIINFEFLRVLKVLV